MVRVAALIEALGDRALRHERVLEVLDVKAARRARILARVIGATSARWVGAPDLESRATLAERLLTLIDEVELLLISPEKTELLPPERMVTECGPTDAMTVATRSRRAEALEVSPESDENAWNGLLGPPSRPRPRT